MSKIVKYLKVHQDLFVDGLGNLGNTLPHPNKRISDLHMSLEAEGVLISTKSVQAIIPYANVVVLTLGEPYHKVEEPKKVIK